MTTAAADLIRQALADAPDGLHVARDTFDLLDIFDGDVQYTIGDSECQPEMRLVGLLLAAAPHLADLVQMHLNCADYSGCAIANVRRAITEAAQAMEAES